MLPYFAFDKLNIGPLTIYVWGLFAGIATVAALFVALKEAARKNINSDQITNIAILIIAGSVIGARSFFVAEMWSYYGMHPMEIFYLGDGGLMFYGGAIGAFVFVFFYIRYAKINNFLAILDTIAPSLAIGELFGRIGCALTNEHVGAITALPWGQFFPDYSTVRHPVSIYMALNGLLIFVILWSIRKKIKTTGMLFLSFLFLYAITRFFLDFTRCGDLAVCDPHYNGFTPSQYISLALIVIVPVIAFFLKKDHKSADYLGLKKTVSILTKK